MRQIVYLLSGNQSPPPILDRQLERFVQRMRDDVEDVIWDANFNGSSYAPALYTAYEALTLEERIRFFFSPEGFEAVYSALRTNSDDNLKILLAGLKNASPRADGPPDVPWLAEQVIPDGPTPKRLLLGDTITVDLGSEQCRRVDITSPVFMSPFEELTIAEANQIRVKLHNALSEIEETAPSLSRLIRNYTRVVYVRKAGDLVPSSEQVDSELGAIRLRNLHSDLYGQDQVVDDFLHESIHNLLGTFEYLNFPFLPVGQRPPPELRPVSPWSMRAIQVLPFLHAAFVYFGMLHYVEGALMKEGVSTERRRSLLKRRNRYASGFLMPGRLSDFAATLGSPDPRVLMALDWMQHSVRSRHAQMTSVDTVNEPGVVSGDNQQSGPEAGRIAA